MGLDINKLIMESIAEVENTTQDVVVENNMHESPYSLLESVAPAVPSAIAAGLGALTIVNRMRNIQESGDEEGWMDKLGKMFTPKEVESAPKFGKSDDQYGDSFSNVVDKSTKKEQENIPGWFGKKKLVYGSMNKSQQDVADKMAMTGGGAGLVAGGAAGAGAMALAKRKQAVKK